MEGADLNISDRVIRVHVVQLSETPGSTSALKDFERRTSSVASYQKRVYASGRASLASAFEGEEQLYEPLLDLEMQAVLQDDEGLPNEFGGKRKLSRQTQIMTNTVHSEVSL